MKATGTIKDIRLDAETRKATVLLEINETSELLCVADELVQSDLLDVELKKHRAKRSLSANAYVWVLLGKLAEKTRINRDEIYRDILKNIGGNYDCVKVKSESCQKLIENWHKNGLGWCGEVIDDDGDFADVILYYGSSTYDTNQMSRLIELVIQECQEQGIATETPEKIMYMESLLSS